MIVIHVLYVALSWHSQDQTSARALCADFQGGFGAQCNGHYETAALWALRRLF